MVAALMSSLILAMAMKNESATVERAIRSIAPICDRAVISIDSLDTEGTRAIAEATCESIGLPVTFIEHVWEANFSKMRNGVLDKIEETGGGDWVIWVDGHEYLKPDHRHALKTVLETANPELWLFSLCLRMIALDGTHRDSFLQAKVWRLGKGIRYERPAHNQVPIDLCPLEHRGALHEIWMMHDRTEENSRVRAAQRAEMFPAELLPRARAGDQDALWHWLSHCYTVGDFEGFFGIKAELYDDLKADQIIPDCRYQVCLWASALCQQRFGQTGDRADLIRALAELVECDTLSAVRNDHLMMRGRVLYRMGDMAGARTQFKLASGFDLPPTQAFADSSGYGWEPWAAAANCSEVLAGVVEADAGDRADAA